MPASVNVTFSRYLGVSADTAYALLCDWEDHGRWVPLTRVTVHDQDSFTAYTGVKPLVLKDEMRVTSRDDNTRTVTIEKLGPLLTGTAGFAVKPFSETSCVVTWEEHVNVPYVPRFAAPVLQWATRLAFTRALKKLPRDLPRAHS